MPMDLNDEEAARVRTLEGLAETDGIPMTEDEAVAEVKLAEATGALNADGSIPEQDPHDFM